MSAHSCHSSFCMWLLKDLFFAVLQMEQENQQLKMANLKQTEQIMLLQDKLQGENCCVCFRCAIN